MTFTCFRRSDLHTFARAIVRVRRVRKHIAFSVRDNLFDLYAFLCDDLLDIRDLCIPVVASRLICTL